MWFDVMVWSIWYVRMRIPSSAERAINHHPSAGMIPGLGIMKDSAFASAATIQIGDQKDKK